MTLVALTLAALLSVCRAPLCAPGRDRARIEEMAEAIAGAVREQEELAAWLPGAVPPPPWSAELAALALVAIASHESGLAADVADCRRVGTDLPSVTAWQLVGHHALGPYTRAELCASPRRAAGRALAVLAHHAARCTRAPVAAFRGYASGDCRRRSDAAARQCALWERLVRETRDSAMDGSAVPLDLLTSRRLSLYC